MNQGPGAGLSAGEVARLLSVAVTTVRSWDRRYGLGPSRRDPGRHRRYDQRDLARLQLMRRLTVEGVAPAEAARIARDIRDPGQLSDPASGRGQAPGSASSAATSLRRAALALDSDELDRILRHVLADGVVPAWTAAIAPALRDLGRRHAAAGRYISAEHLLSAAVGMALARVPRPSARPRVLLACTPVEQHSLPLEALAAALAERGSASRMLGARVPAGALIDAIARTGPTAVVVWAHAASTADPELLTTVLAARARPAVMLACGPGWRQGTLPAGVLTAASLPQAVAVTAELP